MGKRTMQGLGKAARKHGIVVRTLYLSNAEEYVTRHGRTNFNANMMGLPYDARSVTLRTLPWGRFPNRYWTYYIQRLENFNIWMKYERLPNVRKMVGKESAKPRALVHVTRLPKRYLKMQDRPQL